MPESPDLDPSELQRRLNTRIAELTAAHKRIEEMRGELGKMAELKKKLKSVREERDTLKASAEYRFGRKITLPFKKLFGRGRARSAAVPAAEERPALPSYHDWRLAHLPGEADLAHMRKQAQMLQGPRISVVMPVYNTPAIFLEEAVASLRAQVYRNWELIAVDDGSTQLHVRPLLEKLRDQDPRITLFYMPANEGIVAASNAGLRIAGGEIIALLDHDDWLEPDALFEIAKAALAGGDFIYTDEDKVDEAGYFSQPFFKPDWDSDGLLSCNYCCHFTAIKRSLIEEIGGFRAGFDGAQDYDLILRATEKARKIVHIPRAVYHWRITAQSTAHRASAKPEAITAGARALSDAIKRRGLDATVETAPGGARYRVKYRIREPKKISVLIPTRDRLELLSRCVESLVAHTDWASCEIVIVDNGSTDPATLRYLAQTKHKVLKYEGPFNFAAICNFGVRETDGDWILLLNNDTEFTDPAWLSAMAEHVQRPEIGAVGAMLLFPNGLVQHAGVVLTERDVAAHAYMNFPADSMENGGQLQMSRGYSIVTAACMLVRREVYQKLGGLDEVNYAVAYNDVDFCLRLREAGYNVVYTPFARIIHHESASRGYGKGNPREAKTMRERWASLITSDPFSNPNIRRSEADFGPLSRYGPDHKKTDGK
jgi:GT2 family glycosyltransferase